MKKFQLLFTIALAMLFVSKSTAQLTSSTLDILVVQNEKQVLFIKGQTGEIISKVELDEPVYYTSVNPENDTFFFQSQHFLYKGSISSGEIKEEQRVFEDEATVNKVDFNVYISPIGVSAEGVGLWSYNKALIEILKEQMSIGPEDHTAMANVIAKMTRIMQKPTPYFVHDFKAKETTEYGAFDLKKRHPYMLTSNDGIWMSNKALGLLTLKDRITQEKLKTIDIEASLRDNADFLKHGRKWGNPYIISENHFAISFNGVNPENLTEAVTIVCDINSKSVVTSFRSSEANISFPLIFVNSNQLVYAKLKGTYLEPAPKMPAAPTGADVDFKKYQEQLTKYQEDHTAWIYERIKAENLNMLVFRDSEMKEEIMTIQGVAKGQVYNNDYLLVSNKEKVVLYNLKTAVAEWSIKF